MKTEFEDIKIISVDDKATYKDGLKAALTHIVLNLSVSAPNKWANDFNQRWSQHIYTMKRKASVYGKQLEISCVPEELQEVHIPELNKVIAQTNQAYRQHLINARKSI